MTFTTLRIPENVHSTKPRDKLGLRKSSNTGLLLVLQGGTEYRIQSQLISRVYIKNMTENCLENLTMFPTTRVHDIPV